MLYSTYILNIHSIQGWPKVMGLLWVQKMTEENESTSIVLKTRLFNLICKINIHSLSTTFISVFYASNLSITSFGTCQPTSTEICTLSKHVVDSCFE